MTSDYYFIFLDFVAKQQVYLTILVMPWHWITRRTTSSTSYLTGVHDKMCLFVFVLRTLYPFSPQSIPRTSSFTHDGLRTLSKPYPP